MEMCKRWADRTTEGGARTIVSEVMDPDTADEVAQGMAANHPYRSYRVCVNKENGDQAVVCIEWWNNYRP